MSAKYMGMVWELDIAANKSWVLLAMADHADHEGKKIFPSLPLIAWKTGYHLSSVKRIVAGLRDDGILIPYGETQFGVKVYEMKLGHVPKKPEFKEPENGRPEGAFGRSRKLTPSHFKTGLIDTHNRHTQLIESNSNSGYLDEIENSENLNILEDDDF